jgi:hypothetical protein
VAPEDVARIREILDGLSQGERSKLRLETIDGEERLTHWYVIVAARKA